MKGVIVQSNKCGSTAGYAAHKYKKEPACLDCKKAVNEYMRQRRKNNPEKMFEINRRYYLAHKKQRIEYNRKNLKKLLRNNTQRKTRKLQNDYSAYTELEVLELYGSICHICGIAIDLEAPRWAGHGKNWESGLHIDHVIPIVKGGADTLENVRPAHALCNIRKGKKILNRLE